ncbi:MAG: type II toxin-antitoxin system Phd/YefM family antitoxin [Proteobacteria bacterium]|nr:type II toxin-antitoxin system Phd/YefM family antitoxin [Pseudomonadota bacterium]
MKTVSATEAKTNFGKYLSIAISEPVVISKAGHEAIVMISKEELNRLEACEDAYWGMRARQAEKKGYLGEEESAKIIEKLINV